MIPVYIVTGLLGSGKTSLINVELRERKKLGSTEIISFETGNAEFIKKPLSIEPDDIEEIGLEKYEIKSIAADFMTQIDDLIDSAKSTDDKHVLEKISEEAEDLLSTIQETRKEGLEDGEMGVGNIVYKVLRRAGYLDKLWDLIASLYDDVNSVNEDVVADGNADHNPFAERLDHCSNC